MSLYAAAPGAAPPPSFGEHLRRWRRRRQLSQLALAHEAEVSARHLSFVETGRALPSREMVLRLARRLGVPLRERNAMLVAAGYAPMYPERALASAPGQAVRAAVDLVLRSHEPWPALAVDRHWNLVAANRMLAPLLEGVDPARLEAPVNVLRLSLHPQGLASRIINLAQWRAHVFERLDQQILASGDTALAALRDELGGLPLCEDAGDMHLGGEQLGVAMPLLFRSAHGVLSFISTVTVFGTPVDVTLQEVALETFFPADAHTGEVMRHLAARLPA